MEKVFYTYKDIMKLFDFSESKAYEIIKQINEKLKQQGIKTERGRVLKKAFDKEYGISE